MSAFHDVLFPLKLARGAVGGPVRRTDIVALGDGREARNTAFAGSRRQWEVGSAIRSLDELAQITAFFEARCGRLYGFRFRDPADNKSCLPSATITAFDQTLGTGDGTKTIFQLVKTYGDTAATYQRVITKPIVASVRVAINTNALPLSGFSVDGATGLITLTSPPATGAIVKAGFAFDTPARFDQDRLDIALDAFDAGRVVSVSLAEVVP
jgi:uncharacterized protein (TIGR02217 family)